MNVIALLNAAAKTLQQEDGRSLADTIADAFARHGIRGAVEFVAPDRLERAALDARDSARRKEIDAVLVGGGDDRHTTPERYTRALEKRDNYRRWFESAMERYDAIVTIPAPGEAPQGRRGDAAPAVAPAHQDPGCAHALEPRPHRAARLYG